MRLIQLQASNVFNLHAIDIALGDRPGIMEITGPNGAGKSAVLNGLWMLLGGAGAVPTAPIRKGQESGMVRGDFGEYIVTREFKLKEDGDYDGDHTTKLTVETKDGGIVGSPQKFLEGIISRNSFNPMVFDDLKPDERVEALKKFVVGFDFDKNASLREGSFQRRTEVTRDAKAAQVRADSVTVPPECPAQRVDESALLARMEEAASTNAGVERSRAERDRAINACVSLEDSARELEAEIERQKSRLLEAKKAATNSRAAIDVLGKLPDPVDVGDLRQQVTRAQAGNAAIAKREEKARLQSEADALKAQQAELTAKIEALDAEKEAAVRDAKFPIESLSMDHMGVTLNGVPYDQANSAERIRASFALAMADNPKLRIGRIPDGNRLDPKTFALLQDMAEWNDYQILVETVDQRGEVAVRIEEGRQVSR